jgi:hypothetical protein
MLSSGIYRRHIPEDDIHHSHRCENLKSYKILSIFYMFIIDFM